MTTKYKNILFSGLLASVMVFTSSCGYEQEDTTGQATQRASMPQVTITPNDFDNINGVEEDATYTYTVSLSEPQIADIKIQVFQSGGTATEDEDFSLGEHTLIIPAFETSTTGSITIIKDDEPEDSETLQITIGDQTTANAVFTPQVYDFVLDNFVSDELDITLDWDTDLDYAGDLYSACDFIDLDIFVADAEGFDMNDPWATFNGTDYAATGDCPEILHMSKEVWGVGEYYLFTDLWSNQYYFLWAEKSVPITATFVRAGAFRQTVVEDASQAMLSTTPGYVEDGGHAGVIAKVTIGEDTFTISDIDGNDLITGKMVDGKMKSARPVYNKISRTMPQLDLDK